MPTAPDIDEYIAGFPDETRQALETVRALIREIIPEATETISYAIPTFDLDGHHVVHFAAYPNHLGIYPIPHGEAGTPEELKPFQRGKGTARFPLDQPLPMPVIRTMVEALVAEARARSAG
jgi:uncharacterized protein YdhG (YjbR/CyaY superfamily)